MTFQPGESGHPGRVSDKPWADALRIELMKAKRKGGPKAMRRVAARVVKDAENGNSAAWKEIGQRMDGMPGQAIQVEPSSGFLETLKALQDLRGQPGDNAKIIDATVGKDIQATIDTLIGMDTLKGLATDGKDMGETAGSDPVDPVTQDGDVPLKPETKG